MNPPLPAATHRPPHPATIKKGRKGPMPFRPLAFLGGPQARARAYSMGESRSFEPSTRPSRYFQ